MSSNPNNLAMDNDGRRKLVCVTPFMAPYRLHFLRRVAQEIPEFSLATLATQNPKENLWAFDHHPEIGLEQFGHETPWLETAPWTKAFPADWRVGKTLCEWLDKHDVAALYIVGYAYPSNLRVLRWANHHNVPALMWIDSNMLGDRLKGFRRIVKNALLPRILSRCDAVLPCGRYGIGYCERYGVPRSKLFLSPAEPDYSQIERITPAKIEEVMRRFKLDPSRRRMMCCARLVEFKRLDVSIDAFASIAAARPEYDLVIVGDGPLRESLKARVPKHLVNRVFWTGFLSNQEDISALYRCCDALVHPGDYEPWGLVILEAACAGMAIFCSDNVGASGDVLIDGANGRLIPPGNVAALSAILLESTEPGVMDRMKAETVSVLRDWRHRADPVAGLRAALVATGALPK